MGSKRKETPENNVSGFPIIMSHSSKTPIDFNLPLISVGFLLEGEVQDLCAWNSSSAN